MGATFIEVSGKTTGSTYLLKVSNLIQARRCDCAQSWVSMKPPRTEDLA